MQLFRYHDGSAYRVAVPVPYNGRKFTKVLVVDCNDKRGPHLAVRKVPIEVKFAPVDQGNRQQRKSLATLRRLARRSSPKVRATLKAVTA